VKAEVLGYRVDANSAGGFADVIMAELARTVRAAQR
jgi:hypothetical protein